MNASDFEQSEDHVKQYFIQVEPSNHVFSYEAADSVFIGNMCKDITQHLKLQHIPLVDRPYHLYYDPNSFENMEARKKQNNSNMISVRASRSGPRLSEVASAQKPNLTKLTMGDVNTTEMKSSASGWRVVADVYNQNKTEIKDELVAEEEQEVPAMLEKRVSRSSSFNLSSMMQMYQQQTLIRLHQDKRFCHYNFPAGTRLIFQPSEEQEKRVYTGKKNFIRVHDIKGSYKTLYQPEDTPSRYLCEELAEKFNVMYIDTFAIYLKKNGLETLLGDDATPIKMVSEADEQEVEQMEFLFKDAGSNKPESTESLLKKAKSKPIQPLLDDAADKGELDLSFLTVPKTYPKEYYALHELHQFTYNQAKLTADTLPPLQHFSRLTELRLVNNQFHEVPSQVCQLPSLTELDLGNNFIKEIPDTISLLSNLRELYLYVNQIRVVPVALSSLSQLIVLNLSNNMLTQLPGNILRCLTNLEQLKLAGNQLKQLPVEILQLEYLMDLTVARNMLTELPNDLHLLRNLHWLDVQHNQLDALPHYFDPLVYLEELLINHNRLRALPTALGSVQTLVAHNNLLRELSDDVMLDNVVVLNLSQNLLTSLSDLACARMQKLSKLSIFENQLPHLPDSLIQLPALTQIDCKHNHLVRLPTQIGQLTLKVLDCSCNRLTAIPASLWHIPSLWFVQLTNNPIEQLYEAKDNAMLNNMTVSDIFLSLCQPLTVERINLLQHLPKVRTVDMGYCSIKTAPVLLSRLRWISVLFLSGNRLTSVPKELCKLEQLQELYLSSNKLTTLSSAFKAWKQIRVLDLSHNLLKNVNESVGRMMSLEWLDLSSNSLLKQIPPTLASFPRLKTLHVYNLPSLSAWKKLYGKQNERDRITTCFSGSAAIEVSQLPKDLMHCSHLNMRRSSRFTVSVADIQGRRDSMEDCMIIRGQYAGHADWELYGILDGHGGRRVAEFGGEELAMCIEHLLARTPPLEPEEILRQAFKKVQQSIGAAKIGIMEGATAVLALFLGNDLYVANVGDSRAVLSRGQQPFRLSYDHKPELPEEEARIRELGGFVSDGRINSVLAVSRVLGDFALEEWISSEPYISHTVLNLDIDQFLILACDGVWDVMSDKYAVDLLHSHASLPKSESASLLRDYAYMLGSMDNISCCIVHLNNS